MLDIVAIAINVFGLSVAALIIAIDVYAFVAIRRGHKVAFWEGYLTTRTWGLYKSKGHESLQPKRR